MTTSGVTPEAKSSIKTFGRDRFSPGTYRLDLSYEVSECPVELNGERLRFSQALGRLLRQKATPSSPDVALHQVDEVHNNYRLTFPKAEGESDYGWRVGLYFIFEKFVELSANGVNPHEATWFPFDYYAFGCNVNHVFFVVADSKIADQHFHFAEYYPLILKKYGDDRDVRSRGREIYWYKKFYAETMTGQVCVLLPDEPILYHFERPHESIQGVTIRKIYLLLWVIAFLLGAVVFRSIAPCMAGAAGLMLVLLLVFVWETRNVSKKP